MKYLILNILSAKRSTLVGGGHIRSLTETALSLNKTDDVIVYDIGNLFPPKLKEKLIDANVEYVSNSVGISNIISFDKKLKEFSKKQSVDAILCFDKKCYYLCSKIYGIPVILFKCGGPNPGPEYPYAKNNVLYSKENLEWFYVHRKESKLLFLPNRVSEKHFEPGSLEKIINAESKVLLRVCRIDGSYDWTIEQGAHLARCLSQKERIQYVVIGQPSSNDHLRKVRNNILSIFSETVFLTEDCYTSLASSYIPSVDYVLATGRGFMEAAMLGKKLFCPVKEASLPVPIVKETFERSFEKNFSGRAFFDEKEILTAMLLITQQPQDVYSQWITQLGKEHFSAEKIPEKLGIFVRDADVSSPSIDNLFFKKIEILLFLNVPRSISRKKFHQFFKV